MVRRKQPVLVGLEVDFPQARFFHLDRRDLDHIVEVLNRKPQGGLSPYAEALTCLMERLNGCGGNLKKMMDGDPELGKVMAEVCVTRWMPSTNRTAHLVLQPSWEHILMPGQVARMRPERYAAVLFHVGTLNPEWHRLGGPCARCGRYYLKKRKSQKVYCSQRCGNATTATVRTRRQRQANHADKLRRAKAAMREWTTAHTNHNWKVFVSKRELDITPKFLTRSVNKGELKAPTKGR
jgi:hypothetical protein